jgi:aspartate 4-decarboxylase
VGGDKKFGFEPDKFVHELVDSIIGDHYPVPDACWCTTSRSSTNTCSGRCAGIRGRRASSSSTQVEGGTAAMCYIFKSLKSNRILNPGDTIAARRADLHAVHRDGAPRGLRPPFQSRCTPSRSTEFSTPRKSSRTCDPKVKAFFIVNPGNPVRRGAFRPKPSIRSVPVLKKRPDLILLTDDVYGTFVPGFRSLMGAFPKNTIGVYFVQQVLRLHGLAPRARSRYTRTISSTR